MTVQVAEVLRWVCNRFIEVGWTTDGAVNAVIRAQVQDMVAIVQNYHEGDVVRKGQVLFEIDARPFRVALDQANGNLVEQQARWTTARVNLARVVPLAEQNAVSKKDLDDAVGEEQGAHAAVLSARALVEKAALDVGFTRIISPVDGIAGIAKTQIGNLVGSGVTEELTTVSTVDPIRVYICVGEQDYLGLMEPGRSVFREIPLEMVLA